MAFLDPMRIDNRLSARCAAVASIGAAVIHLGVAPTHWRDWAPSGVFFASIAVFQLVWGFLAWSRPTTMVLSVGIAANAACVGLWIVSRTIGIPLGPNAGQPEAVEAAGICVLLLQCYVIMGALWTWLRSSRAQQVSGTGRALVLLGANVVMAVAVTVGLASGLQGHEHGQHAEPMAIPAAPEQADQAEPAQPVTNMGLHTDGHHHDHP
ncbi:hypothetical protein [Mycobacterium sp. M26]|uniref:hypothetical protein n=1 Tax=Mycobacterium sp. M26 TaxID=1762962 RepID=UPI00073F6AE7|nr:hypothetical protein [Mycobacterium sp. M26]